MALQSNKRANTNGPAISLSSPKQNQEPSSTNVIKPQLPSESLGPCAYAKATLQNLLEAGYIFTDEQIRLFSSIEGRKEYTKRSLPMFWILSSYKQDSSCFSSLV